MQHPITQQQIKELQQHNRQVTLIDICTPAEYEKMDVPGALNIPAEKISENISKYATNTKLVCICNKGLKRSKNATETIKAMGFPNVFYLEEGTYGWLAD